MKENKILNEIISALDIYERNLDWKLNLLESKIEVMEKEREYIIKCLKEDNIISLKSFLNIT